MSNFSIGKRVKINTNIGHNDYVGVEGTITEIIRDELVVKFDQVHYGLISNGKGRFEKGGGLISYQRHFDLIQTTLEINADGSYFYV